MLQKSIGTIGLSSIALGCMILQLSFSSVLAYADEDIVPISDTPISTVLTPEEQSGETLSGDENNVVMSESQIMNASGIVENLIPSFSDEVADEYFSGMITTTGTSASGSDASGSDEVLDIVAPVLQESSGENLDPVLESFLQHQEINESEGVAYIEGEVIVKFKESTVNLDTYIGSYALDSMMQTMSLESVQMDEGANAALLTSDVTNSLEKIVSNPGIESTQELIDRIQDDPRVEYVQPNYIYYPQSIPNDPSFSNQANLYNQNSTSDIRADIHYPEAMDLIASSGINIQPTIVAVLDMGVAYDHPDLKNMMWDGMNCKDYSGNPLGGCLHGYDIVDSDIDPRPSIGGVYDHGTLVAGIIGAEAGNLIGIAGVSPNTRIMSVRIMGTKEKPFATTMTLTTGINFARENGAKVINASYGSLFPYQLNLNFFDQLMYTTIKSFPGLFVAAAGNDGINTDTRLFLPAGLSKTLVVAGGTISSGSTVFPGLDNIISVGATDSNDDITYFSNYGVESVDIGAPGSNVYSTIPADVGGYQNNLASLPQWSESVPDGDNTTWTGRLNSSGELISIDGAPGFWPDTKSTFTKNAQSSYQVVIPNTKNYASIGITAKIWCDSPYQSFIIPDKDFLEVEYSSDSGATFTSLGTIHEISLSYLGTSVIEGHTGGLGSRTFAAETKDDDSLILRFRWSTDALDDVDSKLGTSYYGCAIGNISYTSIDNGQGNRYVAKSGTSMATPHVSGAAAIAWGLYPDASPSDIKRAILEGGDQISSLVGKIRGGKRLNLEGMISVLRTSTISNLQAKIKAGDTLQVSFETDHSVFSELRYATNREDVVYSPYYRNAEILANSGIILAQSYSGYQLTKNISRSEFALILAKSLKVNSGLCMGNIFLDILGTPGDTCGYIEELVRQGYLEKDMRYFSPYAGITRSEAIHILTYGLKLSSGSKTHNYTDTANLGININNAINSLYGLGCIRPSNLLSPLSIITRGEAYKLMACALGLGDNSIAESLILLPGINHQIDLSALIPGREYFYGVTSILDGGLSDATITDIHSIFLPVRISQSFSGVATIQRAVYFSDATSSGIDFSIASQSGEITLSNTGNTAHVVLPTNRLKVLSTHSWDQMLYAPSRIDGFSGVIISGSTLPIQSLYSIGGSGTSLVLSGENARISLPVGIAQNGKAISIYRSEDVRGSFMQIGTCTVNAGNCEFSSDHFSYFALGESAGEVIADTVAPVIILSGSTSININQGSMYTDPGATCTDNIDLTCMVTVSGSVNTSQTGTYIITYRAVDQAGNQATPITRTIQVQAGTIPPPPIVPDTTSPVITLSGASTLSITQGNGYTDAGATCTDNIDPTCTVTVSGSVNTSQTGTYTLTYRAVDIAGNQALPVTRTIQVQAGVVTPAPIVTPGITSSVPLVQAGPGGGGGGSYAYFSNMGANSTNPSRIFPTAQSETIGNRIGPKLPGFDLSTISTSNLLNRMVWHTIAPSLSRIEQETAPMAKLIRYRKAIRILDERMQSEAIPRVRSVFEKAKTALIRSEQEYILRTILKK